MALAPNETITLSLPGFPPQALAPRADVSSTVTSLGATSGGAFRPARLSAMAGGGGTRIVLTLAAALARDAQV